MDLRKLALFILMALSLWLSYVLWVLSVASEAHFLDIFLLLAGGFGLLGNLIWIGYSLYLMYCLLPKVDELADPDTHEMILLRGDFMFYRAVRLLNYGGASGCRWCNRRHFKQYDFRQLPKELRIPLAVHFYWMLLGCASMLSAYAALKLME